MEVLPLSLFIVPLLSLALTLFFGKRKSNSNINVPPGSFGWPIMGETFQFLFGKPEKFVSDRMNKYSHSIFKTSILGEKTVVICGSEGHKFIFSNDEKLFTTFRPYSLKKLFYSVETKEAQIMITREAKLKIIRSPEFLKPKALMRYLGKMDSMIQKHLLTHWEGRDEKVIEVYPLAKKLTLSLACHFFLGIDDPERIARLVSHFDDVTMGMHCIPWNIPGTIFYRAGKAAPAIRKELLSILKEKKAAMAAGAPMQDILSHMIVVTDSTGKFMSEAEIANKLMGLLVAGYSAVATTMTFIVKYVGERPDTYAKILTEQMEIVSTKEKGDLLDWEDVQKMKYSWNVACEVMRLTPPFQGAFREALTDLTYDGYIIPKGWKVYWSVSSTNYNSEYFPNPEKFDPSRFEEGNGNAIPFTFVPFGAGPLMCPGKEYTRLAILIFLHNVVKRFKWEVLLPNEKIIGDMIPIPEKGLPIRLQTH